MKKLKINIKINEINYENLFNKQLKPNNLNVLNVNYDTKVAFEKIPQNQTNTLKIVSKKLLKF